MTDRERALTAWQIEERLRPHMTQVEIVGEGGTPTDIICAGTVDGWNAVLPAILSPLTLEMVEQALVEVMAERIAVPHRTGYKVHTDEAAASSVLISDVMNRLRQQMGGGQG